MLKKMAWNTFKNTGNIDTLMELLEVNNAENSIKNIDEIVKNDNIKNDIIDKIGKKEYGNNQNKGNCNFRK